MPRLYLIATGTIVPHGEVIDYCPELVAVPTDQFPKRVGDVLIDPVFPACPPYYWALTEEGDGLREMTAAEKAVVDAQRPVRPSLPMSLPSATPLDRLRQQRNLRLQACDWTQLPDAPLTPAQVDAWREYRQTLRDLPQTCPDPSQVLWPVPPTQ